MKAFIRKYCSEGYDIVFVDDMRSVFSERYVKGILVCVCFIDVSKKMFDV